jgi:uncharacterized ferritin-like protein (DUF455 family)
MHGAAKFGTVRTMKRMLPVSELARDSRFQQVSAEVTLFDPRNLNPAAQQNQLLPNMRNFSDNARGLMHGIFVGEIQALEGAGRTCFDFETGEARDQAPFGLKLDMARQCWDEARHVEISCKLSEHMGSEIGEFAEGTTLYEAACNNDPVFRLCGVNRALEGLAIDVFKTMRDFGTALTDPVLAFCEDWMLADEVTHVKMGSDWLRKVTANDPQRQKDALEFQKAVDKLFSFGGFRGERDDNPVHLARSFRKLAGFSEAEIDELVDISAAAYEETVALIAQATAAMATAS